MADPELIVFERIILKPKFTKPINVKNVGRIPLKWILAGIDLLPEGFTKDKVGGLLKPYEASTLLHDKISEVSLENHSGGMQCREYQDKAGP